MTETERNERIAWTRALNKHVMDLDSNEWMAVSRAITAALRAMNARNHLQCVVDVEIKDLERRPLTGTFAHADGISHDD